MIASLRLLLLLLLLPLLLLLLLPSTQATVSIGGLNAHCIHTEQCDINIARTKEVLGTARGVKGMKGKGGKGAGGKKGTKGK